MQPCPWGLTWGEDKGEKKGNKEEKSGCLRTSSAEIRLCSSSKKPGNDHTEITTRWFRVQIIGLLSVPWAVHSISEGARPVSDPPGLRALEPLLGFPAGGCSAHPSLGLSPCSPREDTAGAPGAPGEQSPGTTLDLRPGGSYSQGTLFGTQSPPLCWMYRRECGHSPGA